MKCLAVIAPRSSHEARAAAPAIRALHRARVAPLISVFATRDACAAVASEGLRAQLMEGGIEETIRSISADGAILMDPSGSDAVDARAGGARLRFGWGERLGALTHAVRPARFNRATYRPLPERTYLDLVGLCGALSEETRPATEVCLPEGRVLIRLPNWLGDIIQCEPLLRSFVGTTERLSLIGPRIAERIFGESLSGARWLDRDSSASAWRDHDLALLLDGSLRSAYRAVRARIPRRVSWARGAKSMLLTDALSPPRELGLPAIGCGVRGSAPRWLARPFDVSVGELASAAGLKITHEAPRLSVSEAGRASAESLLSCAGVGTGESFVLVAAGGRPGSAKRAPAATIRAVLDAFRRESPLPVLLTCGPGEEEHLALLKQEGLPSGVSDCGVTDLESLSGLLERAGALLTADSGPRHLAAALGRPAVVLHGPTDPRHSGVNGAVVKVSRIEVECGPCHEERCPLSGDEHMACFGPSHSGRAAAMLCELLA